MSSQTTPHLTKDQIEAYALCTMRGQLSARQSEPSIRSVEEHVILCDTCDRSVESFEDYIRAMRAAAARLRVQPAVRKTPKPKTFTAGPSPDLA